MKIELLILLALDTVLSITAIFMLYVAFINVFF